MGSIQAEQDGLLSLLDTASRSQRGIVFYARNNGDLQESRISYRELLEQSQEDAATVNRIFGTERQPIVLLHFDSHFENIRWYWAVIHAGLLPTLSTPFSNDAEQRMNHLLHMEKLLKSPVVLTSHQILTKYPELLNLDTLVIEDFDPKNGEILPQPLTSTKGSQPITLMLTSGSTGHAKAVPLTFNQIMSSVRGKSESLGTTTDSVFLNWIGLDHVANLTENHLQAMHLAAEQIHVQADDLLLDPLLFLHLIAKHRVTHTFAPNFFLALLDKKLAFASPDDSVFSLNLSSLKVIMSGGEANVVKTTKSISTRLIKLGAQAPGIVLGYGLTEACAALIYGPFDTMYEEEERHELASIGKPILNAKARISNSVGQDADLYEIGSLELSGGVVFEGYYNNDDATRKAFTSDGWFITGDRAYIDSAGKLNLTGRAKEVIVINGVKFFPQDVENAIEKADLSGIIPSYLAAFPYRAPNSETESLGIVYGMPSDEQSYSEKLETAVSMSKIVSTLIGVLPKWIIPLPQHRLDKSSIGKLSRAKLQAEFARGSFDDTKLHAPMLVREINKKRRVAPRTLTEAKVVRVLSEMLDIPEDELSVDRTVFEIGVTSLTLFRFEQLLRKDLDISKVSVIALLTNPIISSISTAIDNQHSRQYDPVVQLQRYGTKNPLWLVHPASGNVLAFLPLSRTITDRPLYALTAKGLGNDETLFSSIAEMSDTYYARVKETQPHGPYALTGYSLGTTVAFELARRLEADGETVAFCAALDSPPHVIPLVEHLDWTAAAVLTSYFLELIPQTRVPSLITELRGGSKLDIVRGCLADALPAQRAALNLDAKQLLAIVNVTDNFGTMAKRYEPKGQVGLVDVFYCTPLHYVERNREKWMNGKLMQWQDFSREKIEFHECEGDHADMLNPTYVRGFAERLNRVLEARGL